MVKFHSIAMIEKYDCFEPAKAAKDVVNGEFGTVTASVFSPAANGFKVVMNIETGDNAYCANYSIAKGTDLRVADLSKLDGKKLDISAEHLPQSFSIDDKLVATAEGKLEVDPDATAPYLTVVELINFDGKGCTAKIIAQ